MLTGSLEYFSRIWLQFSLTETRQFKCSTNLCLRLPFELRLYSTIFTPLVLFKLVLGNIMSQGCDMVADMLLLKPCNGVAGNQTASLRFPKTAMQMIFQNLCTSQRWCLHLGLWCATLQTKTRNLPKCLEQIRKLRNATYPKT